ncbi:unnamed protein product [Cladocopium goreaui]|uniref:Uncharacterized protein n=1 Tax=Cladocopium goreaui TaxID=2562237 RepID=A0A9P1D7M1_9DINO|nr:unnamed protein product [Cladocopium goreaui]
MTPSQFELFMRRLIKMKTPKVVVMLVLLTSWLDMPVQNKAPFQVLEYYAGVARIATLAKFLGLRGAAVDIEYGKHNKPKSERPPMDINSDAGLILCIHLILTSDPALALFLAVVCSTWVPVNRGSTQRSILTPLGCEDFPGVRRANKMMSRSVILMLLAVALGGDFYLENPHNSLICMHPRYVWFMESLMELGIPTYKITFWMRKWGSLSFKHTWIWSISIIISILDAGSLTQKEKNSSISLTTRYVDKHGRKKFKGNSKLK